MVNETQEMVQQYTEKYNTMLYGLDDAIEGFKTIRGTFRTTLCSYMQFIDVDLLKEEDWPHHIEKNSIYVTFKVDFNENSVELFQDGHIYLSREDQKKTYLAMCSMKDACKAMGYKWFRKRKIDNDLNKTIKAMADFINKQLRPALEKYTGGYPYKEGIVNIAA